MNLTIRFRVLAFLILIGSCAASQLLADDGEIELLEEQAMKAAVSRVAPSVVRLETFGGLESVGKILVGSGPTTGLIVSSDGYIVSSAFNFIRKPASILASLPTGKKPAKIVARDKSRKLVLLKVETDEDLPVPTPTAKDTVTVGQWAIALGKTFDDGKTSMSVGIVSALNRIWNKAIQTDAKISPNNYGGPLVDIQGNVLGVLVPLSPNQSNEVAGAEWYDSGIGFAIPLIDILEQLDTLKAGEDIWPGVMGISFKSNDIYGAAPTIGVCRPKSPAEKAGLKAGDTIVEANGTKIDRIAQLKHVLGPLYAGEILNVVAMREKARIEAQITLTDKLLPYEHPFLGILPLRQQPPADEEETTSTVVRFVYPDSPAEQAGVKPGDTITHIDSQPVTDANSIRQLVANLEPDTKTQLTVLRDSQEMQLTATLARLPTEIPTTLPNANGELTGDAPEQETGVIEIKLPEEPGECIAYVPESYDARLPHSLVVWLHAPGKFQQDKFVEKWKELSHDHGLVMLAPQSNNPMRWMPTEVGFIKKTIDEAIQRFNIDANRVVLHGYQGGGAMAYLVGFNNRELVKGIAVVDTALPVRMSAPVNEPLNRLALYTTTAADSPLAERIKKGVKRLGELKFPVTVKDVGAKPRDITDVERSELARWIDSLDRI